MPTDGDESLQGKRERGREREELRLPVTRHRLPERQGTQEIKVFITVYNCLSNIFKSEKII